MAKTPNNAWDRTPQTGLATKPGPFIAEVMKNDDPLYSGRLLVYIPDFGGEPTQESSWLMVRYMSPYYGVQPLSNRNAADPAGQYESYGMWMQPPDLGVKVLVMFVDGDRSRGVWMGCLPEIGTHGAIPGNDKGDFDVFENQAAANSDIKSIERPPHSTAPTFDVQGLTNDAKRGLPITTSSLRESPSKTFGFNSPGGHSFFMDDGDENGQNKMFRLRTAQGNMIMMNDDEGFVYIINAQGTGWISMSPTGSIDVYGEEGIAMATKGSIQMHADQDINLHANNNIKIVAEKQAKFQGTKEAEVYGGILKLEGAEKLHIHTCGIMYLTANKGFFFKSNAQFILEGSCFKWNSGAAQAAEQVAPELPKDVHGYKSTAERAPNHEPWPGHDEKAGSESPPSELQPDGSVVSGLAANGGGTGVLGGISSAASAAAAGFGTDALGEFAGAAIPSLSGAASALSQGFGSDVLGEFGTAASSVSSAFSATAAGFGNNAFGEFGGITGAASAAAQGFTPLSNALSSTGSALQAGFTPLTNQISSAGSALQGGFSALGSGVTRIDPDANDPRGRNQLPSPTSGVSAAQLGDLGASSGFGISSAPQTSPRPVARSISTASSASVRPLARPTAIPSNNIVSNGLVTLRSAGQDFNNAINTVFKGKIDLPAIKDITLSNPLTSLRGLESALSLTGASGLTGALGEAKNLLNTLQNPLGAITGGLPNITNALAGGAAALQNVISSGPIGALSNIAGNLQGAIGDIGGQLTGALGDIGGQLQGLAGDLGAPLQEAAAALQNIDPKNIASGLPTTPAAGIGKATAQGQNCATGKPGSDSPPPTGTPEQKAAAAAAAQGGASGQGGGGADSGRAANGNTTGVAPSDDLISMITGFEGYREEPYWDGGRNGQWSVGYGSYAGGRDPDVRPNVRLSREEAAAELNKQLVTYRNNVEHWNKKGNYNWTPAQKDALTSFAYNIGSIDELTQNGTRTNDQIAAKMPEYNKAAGKFERGLYDRRLIEREKFVNGK